MGIFNGALIVYQNFLPTSGTWLVSYVISALFNRVFKSWLSSDEAETQLPSEHPVLELVAVSNIRSKWSTELIVYDIGKEHSSVIAIASTFSMIKIPSVEDETSPPYVEVKTSWLPRTSVIPLLIQNRNYRLCKIGNNSLICWPACVHWNIHFIIISIVGAIITTAPGATNLECSLQLAPFRKHCFI